VTISKRVVVTRDAYPDALRKVWHMQGTERWLSRDKRLELLVEQQKGRTNDPNAKMCHGTKRAAKDRTKNKSIQEHNEDGARLSDLVVAVAGLLFATDPALAAVLATSPRPTLDTDV